MHGGVASEDTSVPQCTCPCVCSAYSFFNHLAPHKTIVWSIYCASLCEFSRTKAFSYRGILSRRRQYPVSPLPRQSHLQIKDLDSAFASGSGKGEGENTLRHGKLLPGWDCDFYFEKSPIV